MSTSTKALSLLVFTFEIIVKLASGTSRYTPEELEGYHKLCEKVSGVYCAHCQHASVEELCPSQCQHCSTQGNGVPSIERKSIERLRRQCPQLTNNFCSACSSNDIAEICPNECNLCSSYIFGSETATSNRGSESIRHGQNLLDLVPQAYKGTAGNEFPRNTAVDAGTYWNGDNIGLQQFDDLAAGPSPVDTVLVIGNRVDATKQLEEVSSSENYDYLQAFQQQPLPELLERQTEQTVDPDNLAYFDILTDLLNSEEDQNISN